MKILVSYNSLGIGGVESVLSVLLNKFSAQGHDCHLLLFSDKPIRHELSGNISIKRLKKPRQFLLRAVFYPFLFFQIVREIRKIKPDIIVSALQYPNARMIIASALAGCLDRLVITEHTDAENSIRLSTTTLQRAGMRAVYWSYRFAHHIIAVSKDSAESLIKCVPSTASNVKVIYNFIPLKVYQKLMGESVTHPWLIDKQMPVIITAARLSPEKNLSLLLHAFFHVVQQMPCRLIILGEGTERASLERLAGELKLTEHVSLPGISDNVMSYMARADLFVLSSNLEAFSMATLEALAAGLPVVATRCGGLTELLMDGKYGILVPLRDKEKLADAMLRILKGEVRFDKDAQIQRAQDYDAEKITAQYLTYFQEILDRNKANTKPG